MDNFPCKSHCRGAPFLHWVSYDAYPREDIGARFADNHAFASIIGEGCPLEAEDFDLGLFIIAPIFSTATITMPPPNYTRPHRPPRLAFQSGRSAGLEGGP